MQTHFILQRSSGGAATLLLQREGRSDKESSGGCTAQCAAGFDTASRGGRFSVSSMNLSRYLALTSGLLCQVSNQLGGDDRNKA